MHERPSARSRPAGYVVVLLGALGFVVSCFLPYLDYRFLPSQPGPPSLYRVIMLSSRTLAEQAGGFAYLLPGWQPWRRSRSPGSVAPGHGHPSP